MIRHFLLLPCWGYTLLWLLRPKNLHYLPHVLLICSPSCGTISVQVINDKDAAPIGCAVSVVNENLSVYLQFQGAISAEAELEKIKKKMDEIKK